ncbi:MAG TPA: hypothetical protein VER33_17205 [Polyangiaceae bacterium]|nr:hypothetical protein [Polyangiaceae bacterium]
MRLRSRLAAAAGPWLLGSLHTQPALAQAPAPEEHEVEFTARKMELEPEPGEISLAGDAVVRADRYQLTSEAMSLSRSPRGVHVEGGGRLSFCRCPSPPLSLGFSQADLAPPTDILLTNATLRMWGVPVFWSPYLWLRSPARAGVVPPSLAYRGEEGLLLASGAHLPLAGGEHRAAVVDLRTGVYLRGGARVEGHVVAKDAQAHVAWDHFRDSSVELSFNGAAQQSTSAAFSARVDALRGERALVAPASLQVAALHSDRARLGVVRPGSSVIGVSLQSDARRGADLTELGVFGPVLELGAGLALGPRGRLGVDWLTRGGLQPGGSFAQNVGSAELSYAQPVGAILAEMSWRGRAEALTMPAAHGFAAATELRPRVSLPLARRFGTWLHSLSPALEGSWATAYTEQTLESTAWMARPSDAAAHPSVTALASLESALGERDSRSGGDVRVGAGVAGPVTQLRAVLSARARADARWGRLSARTHVVASSVAADVLVRAELGTPQSVRVSLHADGRRADARLARGLWAEDWALGATPPLDVVGWTTGARLSVPWTRAFETQAGADYDVSAERWLGASAAVAYRHPCRCAALLLWGTQRLGRRGYDAAFSVELVP